MAWYGHIPLAFMYRSHMWLQCTRLVLKYFASYHHKRSLPQKYEPMLSVRCPSSDGCAAKWGNFEILKKTWNANNVEWDLPNNLAGGECPIK